MNTANWKQKRWTYNEVKIHERSIVCSKDTCTVAHNIVIHSMV